MKNNRPQLRAHLVFSVEQGIKAYNRHRPTHVSTGRLYNEVWGSGKNGLKLQMNYVRTLFLDGHG